MKKEYNFIKDIFEELGEVLFIEGEPYYYKAKWDDIKAEQKKQKKEGGDDVRVAGYVLEQLGILSRRVYVSDIEDNKGRWWVFWA